MSPHSESPDAAADHACRLARAVPAEALRVLEVGCGEGRFGEFLKSLVADRVVFGVEKDPALAATATDRLDRVFTLDVERDEPPLEGGSLDVLVYGGVLGRVADPVAVLRRHRGLLKPGGVLLASVANAQHHSAVAALLRRTSARAWGAPAESTRGNGFTWSDSFKLLLDAGFAPEIADETRVAAPPEFWRAAEPLLSHLGLHAGRTRRYLDAHRYVFRGTPLPEAPAGPAEPLTFAACVSDEATLRADLLASPCLRPGTPHEVLLARGCGSAADGLNEALTRAKHRWVVCTHQDVCLPAGWDRRLSHQLRQAEARFGSIGVAGVIGVASEAPADPGTGPPLVGAVVDRDRPLRGAAALPATAETLDELLLVLPQGTPLRLDPALGFHFYGADLCLQARERNLAAVAVEALCMHNSQIGELPPAFHSSGRVFARKWEKRLPVKTTCAVVDRRWLADTHAANCT